MLTSYNMQNGHAGKLTDEPRLKSCSDSLPSTTPLPELEERQFKIAEWGRRRSADPEISRGGRITEQPLIIIIFSQYQIYSKYQPNKKIRKDI